MTSRRISDFEVLELLGEGAMGQVYKAMDINLDRPVAIKLLSNRTFGDKTFLERFRREARLAAKLSHPNIATIYAFGEDNGEPYIAMEFVEGETLEQRIRRKSLSIAEVRKFGEQASSALGAAHGLGIIHRDIKPANLMITREGNLKVMDFGVARRAGETSLTMAGSLIGTANIMAPELIKGKEAKPSADLFSLGCVLYECLAGLPAFHGEDAMAVLYKISNEEPTPLKDLRGDTPDDLIAVITGLLIKDPEKRLGPARVVSARIAGKAVPAASETTAPGTSDLGTMVLPGTDTQAGTVVAGGEPEAGKPEGWFRKNRTWVLGGLGGIAVILGLVEILKPEGKPDQGTIQTADTSKNPVRINTDGMKLLAEIQKAQGRIDVLLAQEAIDKFTEAIETKPDYEEPWNNRGSLYNLLEEYGNAEADLLQAVKLNPEYKSAWSNLASTYEGLGKFLLAESAYWHALDIDSTSVDRYDQPLDLTRDNLIVANNLGAFLNDRERFEEAIKVLEQTIEAYPGVKQPRKNIAKAFLGRGQIDLAELAVSQALSIDSTYVDALNVKAQIEAAKRGN